MGKRDDRTQEDLRDREIHLAEQQQRRPRDDDKTPRTFVTERSW